MRRSTPRDSHVGNANELSSDCGLAHNGARWRARTLPARALVRARARALPARALVRALPARALARARGRCLPGRWCARARALPARALVCARALPARALVRARALPARALVRARATCLPGRWCARARALPARAMWIVAARPLCHLQYPVAYLSRLQRILPAARWELRFKASYRANPPCEGRQRHVPLGGRGPLLLVGKRTTGARVASSPDSDLEAFSHNPTHGSFAPLAFQPSAMTNCANQRFLSY
ncbi:hypothetical protein VNO78_30157 [Psophocarpus tetragonolobus]|uniref:Uncharacterized protein n=1 Tax=Psophocarpus tetragonolobus TaxID=3891 RepID=A0AAN9X400_PSOTE